MRRFARTLGTLMIVAGVGLLAWAVLVWRWEDPFTSLYTAWKQRELASSFDRRLSAYDPPVPGSTSIAAIRRTMQAEATRYRRGAERGSAIGRIRAPRLGVNMIFVEGTDHESLKRGPGRQRQTFMPGEGDLIYIAGHRTTYAAPFSHIDRLRQGDLVTLEMPYATFVYAITRHQIVPSTATWVLRPREREVLALQACHPRFFASHRYIAYAEPVRIVLRGGREYSLAGPSEAVGRS
jgi:sortase A